MEAANPELSEGEVVDEAQNDGPLDTSATTTIGVPDGDGEPKAKKPKLDSSTEVTDRSTDGDQGDWESALTKRQLKKRKKNRQREKRIHQDLENKYAASVCNQSADSNCLGDRQAEVVVHLVQIVSGQQPNRAMLQKIKTLEFQGVVSHLVTGLPRLSEPLRMRGDTADLCSNYRVVVVWMSMISSDFFRNHNQHFEKVKKLGPCVMFDIEHPGSSRFVKLGLENFMMLANSDASSAHPVPEPPKPAPKPRWEYLFSMAALTDNDFPNPSQQGGVDQQGRDISTYCSILEWPEGEVCDSTHVSATKGEAEETMPMFAVDCEMVETKTGSELARISIVNEALECIYDTYVKPEFPVLDYRTRYSGLSKETLEGVTTTLQDVQAALLSLLPPNSILVGHSLENDFHAMKFRHPFVIDTSCIFTPLATPTVKPGLRKLCKELLSEDIQNSDCGHNSIEDATTCMKLVHLKLLEGDSCKIAFNEIVPSIFTDYRTRGCTTGIVDKDTVIRHFGKGSSISVEVKTDEEAVLQSSEVISQSKFTFIQLHGMEHLLKSDHGGNFDKIEAAAQQMDSHVCQLVERCPPKTVVFVVSGSSDIRKVRKIQQQDVPNPQHLKQQVMLARTGCVVGFVVS